MKCFITIWLTVILFSLNVFSQGKSIAHTVAKGENINQIAQLYKVTPLEIYKLNPDAQSNIKVNSVLLIPSNTGKSKTSPAIKAVTHVVAPKETLYGIEKKYGVSDEDLKKANPILEKSGLEIGQTLVIPSKNTIVKKESNPSQVVYHEVLPKETKYSIAKLYGTTIEALEQLNPEIIANLPVGYKLMVKGNIPKVKPAVAEVQPKNTVTKPNPVKTADAKSSISPERKNGTVTLIKNDNTQRKTAVLLLPFNISKIEGDTVNSTAVRLKKDKFLNMTLDFYSGALVAIDSAKQIGLPIDVKIFDSQETKATSNVSAIIKENNLETADVVIGPFYQANVEKTAELLNKAGVPVISPLSKDLVKSYSNLYQTITSSAITKSAIFDYMRAKEGNIIAVIDKKKESVRQYIKNNQTGVSFAVLTETGALSVPSLKSLLVKDKMNYVLMETRSTGLIKATMKALLEALPSYRIQLVISEPNETLETDEIDFNGLVKLKLMYPSMTRENESAGALIFEKTYKKKNKISPSTFATRGFDITFDTLMRLSQNVKYQETVETMITEQVDTKFDYYKKKEGGYANKGVYILYYDSDLTVKEAK